MSVASLAAFGPLLKALLVVSVALLANVAGSAPPSIVELKWLHPDADPVQELTTEPAECFASVSDPEEARLARLGRIAFRSPALLGGVAARIGLSCDSCHRNGHDNRAFFMAGVSGASGTADVTGAVFSRVRNDGKRNPVPIPTLVDRGRAPPFGTVLPAQALRSFLHSAVVDEFGGAPPPQPVVEGLVVYLQRLRSSACPKQARRPVRFEAAAAAALASYDDWQASRRGDDREVERFVLRSLRAELEKIYHRFPAEGSRRETLVGLSRSFGKRATRSADSHGGVEATSVIEEREQLQESLDQLGQIASQSYYEPAVLRQALDSRP
jgi:hypothetical protein